MNGFLLKSISYHLDKQFKSPIFAVPTKQCGVEQLVARRAHNPKVVSSSLAPATKMEKEANPV